MDNDREIYPQEIYPQRVPRKKVSLAKPPHTRGARMSSSFRNTGGRKKISLEKRPGEGIYINPNPVREIHFPSSPMPAIDPASAPPLAAYAPPPVTAAVQMPATPAVIPQNNIATAVGAAVTDPNVTAEREGRALIIREGDFRCAYNSELTMMLATAVPAALFVGYCGISVAADIVNLFDAMTVLAGSAGIFLSLVFGAVCYGKSFHFSAEKDAFVISRRGSRRYYYYADIIDIRFEEFGLFGKKRGYAVTIKTRYGTDTYRYIFGENRIFTDATNTPFYYLMRNARLTNAAENSLPDPDRFMKRRRDPDED